MADFSVLLTVQEVASRLGISRGSVYELVKQGRLAVHRVGSGRGTIRISENDLQAYLESCRSDADGKPRQERTRASRRKLKHIHVGGK